MQYYEVDPLVSIHVDDVVNTFYPSRIDNTKLMIGGQNCFEVFSIDSEWKYKNEQIRLLHRSREPYPIIQMKPHPNEMYTMATANGKGKVLIWDFNYDKHIKSFYPIGSHPVMCQGLSWCPFNPNLLLSCGQEGMICLWDRRDGRQSAIWEYPSGASGFSYVKFDPFHENLFACIHDHTTIRLFDISMQQPVFSYTSETNTSFNTIHYNPYKSNIMAVGCTDHSIKLFSTQNNELANLYSSFYHNTDHTTTTEPPSAIETDFEVRDISWNPQNPNVLAACGMSDCDSVGIWDIRRPNLPYRVLHQTQRVKEISWTTHPGSSSSEYLAILQEVNKQSMIDIFVIHSLPLYSNTICNTSISLSKWYDIAVVLNGDWKQQDHIPSTVADNEYISCIHQSPIMILKGLDVSKQKEGYSFNKQTLSYLIHSYQFYSTSSDQTIESICHYNAMVCEKEDLQSIATIWLLLENLASIVSTQKYEENYRTRSQSIISPRLPRSRGSSLSSLHHSNSVGDHMPRSNSFVLFDDTLYEPDLCNFYVHLSLNDDLHFLYDLVREGDLLNAITIACVFWNYLSTDVHAIHELQKWLYSYMEILSYEEMYEEIIIIRKIASTIKIPFEEDYHPNITFQTATKQDQEDFRESPRFFAYGTKHTPACPTSSEEVPFIVTGSNEGERKCKSCSSKNHKHSGKGGKKDMDGLKRKGTDSNIKMEKSKDSNVNSFCSVCRAKNQGLVAMCLRCGHGGHLKHIQEWFGNERNQEKHCAIASCTCHCVFSECNLSSFSSIVC